MLLPLLLDALVEILHEFNIQTILEFFLMAKGMNFGEELLTLGEVPVFLDIMFQIFPNFVMVTKSM